MHRDHLLHGLQLDDDSLNHEIYLVCGFQSPATVLHLERNVAPEFQPSKGHFLRQAGLIG